MLDIIPAVILAFFYSFFYTIVGPMMKEQDFGSDKSRILPFVVCFAVCTVLNFIIFHFLSKIRFGAKDNGILSKLDRFGEKKLFLIIWALILASWIPAYLILYPGVLSYDAISQTDSALTVINSNHHPVLHTWLIRVFMKMGESLSLGYEFGIGVLSGIQMIVLSYALTRLVFFMKKRKTPMVMIIITMLVSAFWFENAVLASTMVKDVLYAAFLVLFLCHYAEIVTDVDSYFSNKRNLFLFPIISFLMCAFRNNGLHIYVFCFLILLLMKIRSIKKAKRYIPLLAVIVLPVILFKIYSGPVFNALNIEQGQVREALCIPIQQIQRVSVLKGYALTDEQRETINYYIDDLNWAADRGIEKYDPFTADPAKSCFYSERYEEETTRFWKNYFQIGRQFSKEYAVAFLSNTLGFWYPGYYSCSYVMFENYPPEWFSYPLERDSILTWKPIVNMYESLCCDDSWRTIPVVRLFFVPGFVPWLLIYGFVLAVKKHGFSLKRVALFVPLIAQGGIMLLSPMSSFRYSWPFFLMLPIVLTAIWGETDNNSESIKK